MIYRNICKTVILLDILKTCFIFTYLNLKVYVLWILIKEKD